MRKLLDLFYEENRQVHNFENGVREFKRASRNLQYGYNLARSLHIHQGVRYHEAVEPILELVERFKDLADTLYQLRKMTPSRPIRMILEGFDSSYIASRLTDGDIVDMESSPEKISRVMMDMTVNLRTSALSFSSSFPEAEPISEDMLGVRTLVLREYVV